MKKLLTFFGVVAFGSMTATSVVACKEEGLGKTPQTLNEKSFDVKVGSFTSPNGFILQNQWGENSIGALYASLWSINNKPAIAGGYFFQNNDVKDYLTKGESITRSADDGANVTVNGKVESDRTGKENPDWHFDVLKAKDKVVFALDLLIYSRDAEGNLVSKPATATITINIIAAK